MALYKSIGLTAKTAAAILAEIVSMINKKLKDDEMLKLLNQKFSGLELVFASYLLGRIVGMSYAIKDMNSAIAIISDFRRYIQILEERGKEELEKVVENEILDEVIREIERMRDVI
uniref:Uncharacterized protein n=1 Tax=Archaeoglobus fulgidus TaxID=2234 RepID=A0A7J2TJY9_ARCFL